VTRISQALVLLFSAAWLGVAGPHGLAAQPVPLGPESRLSTGDSPGRPVLAVRPGGDSVIAWDDLPSRVFAQHVAAGAEPGDEAPMAVWVGLTPAVDAVTATTKGFDVQWHVFNDLGETAAFYRRHLNAQGVPDPGRPVLLGRAGTNWVWNVGGSGGDQYLAGWTLPRKHGIAARRLTAAGRQTGPELRLNSRAVDALNTVAVPVAGGGFAAVWYGEISLGEGEDLTLKVLRARLFSSAGRPLGPDFDVNTIRPGEGETVPALNSQFQVAAAPGGGFAVSWALGQTIYLRSFDAAGHAQAPEVAAVTAEGAYAPASMAFDDQGNLALLWIRFLDDSDLQLQIFDAHGVPLGPPADVKSAASDGFTSPRQGSVAWAGDSWLVTWVAATPDGGSRAIFVRRFAGE
jgi:hypothetical protein